MTGDYFDRRYIEAELIALLDAVSPYPIVSVLGNHDYRLPPAAHARLIEKLKSRGGLLRNQVAKIAGLTVYGMDDPVTGRAAQTVPPVDLVIAHSPDLPMARSEVPARLILAGHYHGGQVRILPPRLLAALFLRDDPLARRGQLEGWFPGGPPPMYVARGLGESGLSFRLFCPPEIAVLEPSQKDGSL